MIGVLPAPRRKRLTGRNGIVPLAKHNMLETESDRTRLLMGSWEWHGFEIQV